MYATHRHSEMDDDGDSSGFLHTDTEAPILMLGNLEKLRNCCGPPAIQSYSETFRGSDTRTGYLGSFIKPPPF